MSEPPCGSVIAWQQIHNLSVLQNVTAYRLAGRYFSLLQNGKVRFYALYILAGVAVISTAMLGIMEAY